MTKTELVWDEARQKFVKNPNAPRNWVETISDEDITDFYDDRDVTDVTDEDDDW